MLTVYTSLATDSKETASVMVATRVIKFAVTVPAPTVPLNNSSKFAAPLFVRLLAAAWKNVSDIAAQADGSVIDVQCLALFIRNGHLDCQRAFF